MDCTNILHIIGDIASIITVIGGIYGFCRWVKTRRANVVALYYTRSEQHIYMLYVYNEGLCEAHDVKLAGANIESHAFISALQPGEEKQLSFECNLQIAALPIRLYWRDAMGGPSKCIKLTASMRKRY